MICSCTNSSNKQVDNRLICARESDIYSPNGTTYRIGTADLDNHITFMANMNAKLNPGSDWWMEIGHNGNGNIEVRASSSFLKQ